MMTSQARSVAKALTWRILGTLDTFLLGYLITGHVATAGAIASVEVFSKTLLYYLHERGWALVQWGHDAPPKPVFDRVHHTL